MFIPFLSRWLPILALAGTAGTATPGILNQRVPDSGLPTVGKSFGATWADLNHDGKIDLLISLHGKGVYGAINQGGLRFSPVDPSTFLPDLHKDNHGIAACDFDGDGQWEFYISVGAKRGHGQGFNELWDRGADGNYHDILATQEQLTDPEGRGRGAIWVNLDGDGFPELLVLNFRTPPRLFHFTGQQWDEWSDQIDKFRENRLQDMDPQMIYWRSVAAPGDLDGDGREDLYVAGASSIVYHNNGRGEYEDVTPDSGLPPFPPIIAEAVLGDVDSDGDLDLLTVQKRPGALEIWLNQSTPGTIRFTAGPSLAHLDAPPWLDSAVLADFDNDGLLDLYVTGQMDVETNAPNLIARGLGTGDFTLMTPAWDGGAEVPALPCGAWAVDGDNDGDLDLLALHGKEDYPDREGLTVLYENTTSNSGFTLELTSAGGRLMPLGTMVELTSPRHHLIRRVRSRMSYWNATVLPLHFGVEEETGPFDLNITWPDGRTQKAQIPAAGTAYTITEGHDPAARCP